MEQQCHPAPADKKEYITQLGKSLVENYGKKKYYSPEEVEEASKKNKSTLPDLDWVCWGMSVFTDHTSFDAYHKTTGEVCDYVAMKTEMLKEVAPVHFDWTSIPDLDIDASWLDLGDFFSGLFEGIIDVVGGLFD